MTAMIVWLPSTYILVFPIHFKIYKTTFFLLFKTTYFLRFIVHTGAVYPAKLNDVNKRKIPMSHICSVIERKMRLEKGKQTNRKNTRRKPEKSGYFAIFPPFLPALKREGMYIYIPFVSFDRILMQKFIRNMLITEAASSLPTPSCH